MTGILTFQSKAHGIHRSASEKLGEHSVNNDICCALGAIFWIGHINYFFVWIQVRSILRAR